MNKDVVIAQAKADMRQNLSMPEWSVFEKIALAGRILFSHGHGSGLAGQITARIGGNTQYITQQFGLGFDEITTSNLLVVDAELNIIRGEGMPNPANRFHLWIYRARPDVQCVIHTHPVYISALSMLGRSLEVAHMDTCMLYDDVAYLENWPGVPVSDDEGEIISAALGNKRAALLAHHGLVVACQSVEEACVITMQCEYAARLQILAESVGKIRSLDPSLGHEAHDWLLNEKRTQTTFHYYARAILRNSADCLA